MNTETLAKLIQNLGRPDFKNVVQIVLTRALNFKAINVNGPHNGGSDWAAFHDVREARVIAFQDSTQKGGWERKALEDARKAVKELGAKRYFFFTTNNAANTTLRQVENSITEELGISAMCLGASNIAEFITSYNLETDFLDAIGAPLAPGMGRRPDSQEMCLHMYLTLARETHDLKDTVYDDTIFLVLHKEGELAKEGLMLRVVQTLQCDPNRSGRIETRIESLRSHGLLITGSDATKITLSSQKSQELKNSERVYLTEFRALASAQVALMQNYDIDWNEENAELAAVMLTRAFIQKQLENVNLKSVKMASTGLTRHIGRPLDNLKELLRNKGIPNKSLDLVISELVNQAKDLPVVKKLARAAVFVALEGSDPLLSSKAFGASRWTDVNVMLDAAVAIPYLCARLYEPTKGRFSPANYEAITTLQKLNARVFIPYHYISECASHLIKARTYEGFGQFADALEYSDNGYITHYYHLRNAGVRVPQTILEYLGNFAHAVLEVNTIIPRWIRNVMTELQRKFSQYNLEFVYIPRTRDIHQIEVETKYAFYLRQWRREKSQRLIDNDVQVLSHVKREVSQKDECWMFLTWDRAMLSVGQETEGCGWVVSPDVANDFASAGLNLTDVELCALAHSLAKTHEEPLIVTARIIDHVAEIADARLQDWEFQNRMRQFSHELYARIDFKSAMYNDVIERETDRFLQEAGIDLSQRKPGGKADDYLPDDDVRQRGN